jgi:hypothetical protein
MFLNNCCNLKYMHIFFGYYHNIISNFFLQPYTLYGYFDKLPSFLTEVFVHIHSERFCFTGRTFL